MLNQEEIQKIRSLPLDELCVFWDDFEQNGKKHKNLNAVVRELCQKDLAYLLIRACRRVDMLHPWIYARIREVEANPNGYLDLWAREHNKSSIITFGLIISDILNDPEVTFGIFSHTRPIAKAFLRQIMRELEANVILHNAFPDILWGKNVKESPKWCLDINTPVLTVDGWKKHGDLKIGDKIFGSCGQVITVIGNSGKLINADCRRVVFDDGELIASAEHRWAVECKKTSWEDSEIKVLTTDQLTIGTKKQRIPATPGIYPEKETYPEIPYLLGLWLGDGTAGTNIISVHRDDEDEFLYQAKKAGYETYVHRRKINDKFSMYGLRGLKEDIKEIGCLTDKHIPENYLFSNYVVRLSLLQGLMDSDGTCKGKSASVGMCMFSNTNKNLAEGVKHLATSLGLRPSMIDFMPKSRGKKRVYQVYFVGIKSIPPFRIKRKLANCKDKRTKVARYVRKVEKIDSVTVNCIKVDAKDSLYLAGRELIPTHNSEDDGIIVKRKSNPKEATIEAYGLIDGQPTSKHFKVLMYDDIVVRESVTTPEMIAKTMNGLEQSYNLGVTPGGIRRFAGTRWHYNDAYSTIKKRGSAIPREHPGREGGLLTGKPVLWSEEIHEQKRIDMDAYNYSAQILMEPKEDSLQGFQRDWIQTYNNIDSKKLTKYILVDAASSKKRGSDFTAMFVVGLGGDDNYYVLDMVRDRLNLKERADCLFELHRKWKPKQVRYEKYGAMADIEHMQDRMEKETYNFKITEVGGQTSKSDRIKRLLPLFEGGRLYFPRTLHRTNWDKKTEDLVKVFIEEEYLAFPVGSHDDMLDSLARICEPNMDLAWPSEGKVYVPPPTPSFNRDTAWMGG